MTLKPVNTRDKKILKRWSVADEPRGAVVAPDGTLYVGLAKSQSVIAVDAATGTVKTERVLDREEIASTKELVALRLNADASRLIIANGSDESVTILSLPELVVEREIGLEGEAIRDAIPDPKGRHLYVLGRVVHVYDATGEREIRALDAETPMAIALSRDGGVLAVAAREQFSSGAASVVILYDTSTLKELAREPLQTDRLIESLTFGANDRALVFAARDWLAEKDLNVHQSKASTEGDRMRMKIDFGDLVSSENICLATPSGPQALVTGGESVVHFAERRCGTSGSFTASTRKVKSASLYGVNAFALAFDRANSALVATDPAGYLTIYKAPQPVAR